MKNVIITGADGFVGSYTVECFLQNGVNVLALDIGEKAKRLQAHDRLQYKKCDITDIDAPRCFLARVIPELCIMTRI